MLITQELMEPKPLVSILMPCFNSERYLKEAINSIINQTYSNWELLICNDASTDNSLEVLKSFESKNIKIINNESNLGYLKSCNKLFKLTKGKYITFQDSDDYSSHNRIELLVDEFDSNPNLGACGTQFNFITNEGIVLSNQSPTYPQTHQELVNSFLMEPAFCGASVMVPQEVILDIGIYNEYWDRIGAEDFYWLYLIAEKYEVKNLNSTEYFYRHNPNSITRNKTNPRKIHSHDFLVHFIKQRQESMTDSLEQNNIDQIREMENKFIKPYQEDITYIYKRQIDWALSDNNKRKIFKLIFKAIKTNPTSLYWYKTLIYYFRKLYL